MASVSRVDCDTRKWGDLPHWRFDSEFLGRDVYGSWLGVRPSTPYTGPRGEGAWEYSFAMLVPDGEWWISSFNDENNPLNIDVYVDVTTPAEWLSESHLKAVDLDLDVIRYPDGRMVLDDEDEFEEHRVEFGYPDDVVERAIETAHWLLEAVGERREPFDQVGKRWLEALRG